MSNYNDNYTPTHFPRVQNLLNSNWGVPVIVFTLFVVVGLAILAQMLLSQIDWQFILYDDFGPLRSLLPQEVIYDADCIDPHGNMLPRCFP